MRLVVGIGNRSRGDDGVGPLVAEQVAALGLPGVEVVAEAEPLELLELLDRPGTLVVVDAVAPRGTPGRVTVTRAADLGTGSSGSGGTHGFGVLETVSLARAVGRLRADVVLVGVEASTVEVGAPLSDAVRDRIGEAALAAGRAAVEVDASR